MRCRKNYRDLNAVERDRFVQALYHAKSTGIVDQFANDHDTYFHEAHHSSHFLPWHREFLRRFENELRTYHPDVTIPYWNSTLDNSPSDPLWNDDFVGQFDSAWGLERTLGADTLPPPDNVQTALGHDAYDAFWSYVEGEGLHNPPHRWVGGAMATASSPRDPVFYLHHCWIDLIWAQWQLQHPGAAFVASHPGRDLNDAMEPWPTTPADVLDHRTINLYHYPSGFQQDPPVITLETPTINFNDVPEGETAPRAASFSVSSCIPIHFEIDNPVVTMGPPGIFGLPFGNNLSLQSDEALKSGKAYVWITYTGTSDGESHHGTVTVRNIETNQEWPNIPITANTVRRPTVAVGLVLDKSGSMSDPSGLGEALSQRIKVLRFAANHFVDVIRENNAIGIASFNQDAAEEMPITQINTIDPIDPPRLTAKATIENINPGGSTSIGDGIEKAHDMLDPVTGHETKATIVFTDGHENSPKYISDIADKINEKVFAIGLGTAQQLNPTALEAITNGTGGHLLLTGQLNPDYYFLLSKYFLQILAGVTNEDIVLDPEGWIKPGQEHRIPFRLNEADISTDIILIQQSGITRISGAPTDVSVFHFNVFKFLVESPNGDKIDPTVASTTPGASYVDGTNLSFYRVALPLPIGNSPVSSGIWHAILTIDEEGYKKYLSSLDNYPKLREAIKTHGIRYSLTVHAYSNVRMRSTLSQNSYEPGATMNLRTKLTQYGMPLKSSATVRAELRRPDNTTSTLNLSEVQDGVFETNTLALMPGIYHFRVYCNGVTLRGRPFTREEMLTGAVWRNGDLPPPTGKEDPRERDEKLCKLLDCILSKEVISQELERRLSTVGINIGILRKCLKAYCTDVSLSTESPAVSKNELSSLLQNPTILSFLKGIVEEMQRRKT